MRPSARNPLPLAAGRASEAFCLATEPEHSRPRSTLLFDDIEQSADRAASIWRSIAEASFRGDAMTVAVHLRQVRLVTFHVHELVKQFGGSNQEAWAA
jgi:hypothetical protein